MDFAKAFDSVDYCTLLVKLKSYGVTGKLLNWFADYLHGRLQRVVVDVVASQCILGPLLFAIFINDFPDVVKDRSQTALYADDSKIYESISSIQCCETLYKNL